MKYTLIAHFESNTLMVDVYKLEGIKVLDEQAYAIISTAKKDNSSYVRFGNGIQVKSIMNTYTNIRRFEL